MGGRSDDIAGLPAPDRSPPGVPAALETATGGAVRIEVTREHGAPVVRVSGELDIAARTQLDGALARASCEPEGRLTVDVSRLRFIDASGLGLLVRTHNRLVGDGGRGIVVRGASGMVRRVFAITALTSLLGLDGPLVDPALDGAPSKGSRPTAALEPTQRSGPVDLERARQESGLALRDLFVAYFGLGGTADLRLMAAHLGGAPMDSHEHDIVVHALNERFIDLGRSDRLLTYTADR